jgi:hypothetical protein
MRRPTAATVAVLTLAALAACRSPTAKTSATPTTASPSAPLGLLALAPDGAQLPKLIAGLSKINPKLTASADPVPTGTAEVCADIRAGADDTTAAQDVMSSGFASSGVDLNPATSKHIVAVIKETFCH